MRSSHAARTSSASSNLISRFISILCAVTLCCGLVPSAALAADQDSLSLIPEGAEGVASIASSAEGGDADGFSHYASGAVPSADGSDAAIPSEDASNTEPDLVANDLGIINQVEPLQVVAQAEFTKNYFLAQTLESIRTVPMVSASMPLDEGTGDGESVIASTVIGSFEYLGMTFAIESGGESIALVAAEYSKLPQDFIEKQVLVIPETATPDGIDYYSVTRIADNAFIGFTEQNADPNYIGCEALFSDAELLAGVDTDSISLEEGSLLAGCVGILVLDIPSNVIVVEDNALSGFDTFHYVAVYDDSLGFPSEASPSFSFDVNPFSEVLNDDFAVPDSISLLLTKFVSRFEHYASRSCLSSQSSACISSSVKAASSEPEIWTPGTYISTTGFHLVHHPDVELYQEETGPWGFEDCSDYIDMRDDYAITVCFENTAQASRRTFYYSYDRDLYLCANGHDVYRVRAEGFFTSSGRWYVCENGGTSWELLNISSETYGDNCLFMYVPNGSTLPVYADVHWDLDGGSNGPSDMTSQSSVAYPNTKPQKFGYLFCGWEVSGGGDVSCWPSDGYKPIYNIWAGGTLSFTEDITLTALWGPISYSVLLDVNDGITEREQIERAFDDNMALPTPTRSGYAFVEWNTEPDGSGFDSYPGGYTGDLTAEDGDAVELYAQWKLSSYYVIWDANDGAWEGGETFKNTSVDSGSTVDSAFETDPIRAGYAFQGWATENDATAPNVTFPTGVITSDITYYAVWSVAKYTITWYPFYGTWADGTSSTQTTTVKHGEPTTAVDVKITRTGYTLLGWATSNGSSKPVESFPNETTSDASYYAVWGINEYIITWNANGGTLTNSEGVVDTTQTMKVNHNSYAYAYGFSPTRAGYTFLGWGSENTATSNVNFPEQITAAKTYYARWSENGNYSMTFKTKVTGSSITLSKMSSLPYESKKFMAPTADEIKSKSPRGYRLLGWSKQDPGMTVYSESPSGIGYYKPNAELSIKGLYGENPTSGTLFAIYALDTFKVSLNHNGGAFASEDLKALETDLGSTGSVNDAGTEIDYTVRTKSFSVPDSSRSGYTFSKWLYGDVSAPTIDPSNANFELQDYSFVAEWTTNGYSIKLQYKDALENIVNCVFADPADAPEYVFDKGLGESYSVVLKDPYRRGYEFTGWSGPGLEGDANKGNVTIYPNTLIDGVDANNQLVYTANWKAIVYKVEYDMADGNYIAYFEDEAKTNPETYTFDETWDGESDKPVIGLVSPARAGYMFNGWKVAKKADGSDIYDSVFMIDRTMSDDLTYTALWTPVVSVTLPVTTPVDFAIDAASGKTEEAVNGTSKTLSISSTTPVDTALSLCSSAVDDDAVKALFEEQESGALQALIDSLGFGYDLSGSAYVSAVKKNLKFLRKGGSVDPLVIGGSQDHAKAGSKELESLTIEGPFSLLQTNDGGMVFTDLLIDLSKVHVKSAEELKDAVEKVHLADIVWTVSIPSEENG